MTTHIHFDMAANIHPFHDDIKLPGQERGGGGLGLILKSIGVTTDAPLELKSMLWMYIHAFLGLT